MYRDLRTTSVWPALAGLLLAGAQLAPGQERRTTTARIDVEQYTIDADVNPATSTLAAKATVRFTPVDDNIGVATFELNNALNVARVTDDQGKQIPASR